MDVSSSLPLVSVVITTKNEEANIQNCLRSIRYQTYPAEKIEIILVDNGSSDRTKEIAQEYTSLVFDKGPERSAQRNFGILSVASGIYALFLDADMILSPVLVEHCVQAMEEGTCVALHVPEIILGTGYWSAIRRFERSFYDGTVIDGARFFRRDTFVRTGGFDETLSGPEDWDLDKKLKAIGKIGLVDAKVTSGKVPNGWEQAGFISGLGVNSENYSGVVYHNESEFNLISYIRKKGYYARDMDRYISKWGQSDPDIKKQLGLGYRFCGVFIENGKWKKLLSKPLLTFGMYFLRFLVGLGFLLRTSND